MTTALILFAHGARDPEWANPMRRVQASIRQQVPGLHVELAFLEFMTPTLLDSAEALIASGIDKLVVMPMFIARGGHLKRELPEMIEALRASHPDVEFFLGGAIGENETVIQAMAEAAVEVSGVKFA